MVLLIILYIIENYEIDAHGAGDCIYIGNTTVHFMVRNCKLYNASWQWYIYNEGCGITLYNVTNGRLENNTYSDCWYAIYLRDSSNNTLYSNKMQNCGIFLDGSIDTFTTQHIATNNTVNNKPVYYYKNANMSNLAVPSDAGEVILGNISYLIIENLNLSYGSIGIEIGYSHHITVRNCICSNNNRYGIYLVYSNNNALINNTCINNEYGIYLYDSDNNNIIHSLLTHNTNYAIYIDRYCSNNFIYNNSFYYNHGSGDTFNSSLIQAYDGGSNNWWNSSSGYGNYWHDWANNNNSNDLNGDGIVDWPYPIDGSAGAKDYYPLANPTVVPEISTEILWVIITMCVLVTGIGWKYKTKFSL